MCTRILIFVLLIFSQLAAQEYLTKHYTTRTGLPTNRTFDVLQSEDGLLWFASEFGVFTYDGFNWNRINNDSTIFATRYNRIKKDKNKSIWILPESNRFPIAFRKNNEWSKLPLISDSQLNGKWANNIAVVENNLLLLFEFKHLYYFNKSNWEKIDVEKDIEIKSIVSYKNEFYLSTNKGLAKFDGKSILFLHEINKSLPGLLINYASNELTSDNKNLLWLLGRDWLGYFDGEQFISVNENITFPEFYTSYKFYYIKSDKHDNIYFGNEYITYHLKKDATKVREVILKTDLQLQARNSIEFDYENNIWMTTNRGIVKIRQTPFEIISKSEGLNANEITSVLDLGNGNILLGQEGVIATFNKDSKILKSYRYLTDRETDNNVARIWNFIKDNNNNVWVTDYYKGFGKLKKDFSIEWKNFNEKNFVFFSALKEDNIIWLATREGAYEYNIGNDNYNLIEDIPQNSYRKVKKLLNGKMAFCTSNKGIFIYDNKVVKNYKSSFETANNIYAIHETPEFGILVGSGKGLYRVQGDSLAEFSIGKTKINTPIFIIENGHENDIWFGTDIGIYKYDGHMLRKYTTNDGLAGTEINRGALAKTNDNKLLIGTEGGLSIYDPDFDNLSSTPPKGKILCIRDLNDSHTCYKHNNDFPYSTAGLIVEFRGLSFLNEKDNEYLIELYNDQEFLIDRFMTKENNVRLSNLSWGSYYFKMQVQNPNGLVSDSTYITSFSIDKPYYLKFWFLAVISILGSVFIYIITSYQNQKKYAAMLEDEVQERTVEIEEQIAENKKYAAAIKQSEEKFRNLFENSAFGIYQTTLDGTVILCNQAWLTIFGYNSFKEIQNYKVGKDFYLNEKDRNEFKEILFDMKSVNGYEAKYKRKTGEIIYVREFAKLTTLPDKKLIIEGAIEDITHQKISEQKLIEAKDKAEKADKLKSEFLAQVSHEIRTPINSMISFSSLLISDLEQKVNEELSSCFNGIQNAGMRIIRTIDLLINVSELQTQSYEASKEKFDLVEEVFFKLIIEYKPLAESKNLSLEINHEGGDHIVFGDIYSINQIFANLIDNAIKYTQKGKISINLVKISSSKIEVEVEDTGIGISEEYLSQLFQAFSQEEQGYTRKYEGNGLGLFLVKKYCEINDAKIRVESIKGKGSKFIVTLKN